MSPARGWLRALGALAFAAGVLAPPAAGPARAGGPGVAVRIEPDTVLADENGTWSLRVTIGNRSPRGIYGDSLLLSVQPSRPGAAGAPASFLKLPLPQIAAEVSAGDSFLTEIHVAASARRARLEVRFHSHDGSGTASAATAVAHAAGSVLEARYPATIARVGGQEVEMIRIAPEGDFAVGTGVLILPGEGTEPGEMLAPAVRLARQGHRVVIAGLPGTGRSGGTDDFAGRASLAAASAALDTLASAPGVDRERLAVWGISRGGTLALRLALERPQAFRAVVAQAASYDLWASYRAAGLDARRAIEAAAGRDSAGWTERSPLLRAAAFKPAVLVLHGERDDVFPVAAARAFAQAATAAGARVTGRFLPQARHDLPAIEATRFLHQQLTASR